MRHEILEREVLVLHFLDDRFEAGEGLLESGLSRVVSFSVGFAASHGG
jgi:hypothetical protein